MIGMVNQLPKLLSGMAKTTKPMRSLLQSNTVWIWSQPQQEAFSKLKKDLTSTPVLAYYSQRKALIISCDASSYGIYTVLLQVEDSREKWPVAYASTALSATEQKYAQVEKEAHGPVNTSAHTYYGCNFKWKPTIKHLRMRILEFDFVISHVPGKGLHTADVPSWKLVGDSTPSSMTGIEEYELLSQAASLHQHICFLGSKRN